MSSSSPFQFCSHHGCPFLLSPDISRLRPLIPLGPNVIALGRLNFHEIPAVPLGHSFMVVASEVNDLTLFVLFILIIIVVIVVIFFIVLIIGVKFIDGGRMDADGFR